MSLFMFQKLIFVSVMAITVVFVSVTSAQESQNSSWPNWRGPNQNGSADSGTTPTRWSETENVLWKVALQGKGSATPVIWGEQIIVLSAVPAAHSNASDESNSENSSDAITKSERGRGARGVRGGGATPLQEFEFTVISLDRKTGQENWKTVVTTAVPHESGHNTNTFASASPVTNGHHIYASFGSNGIYCLGMQGKIVWQKSLGKMQTRNSFGEGASPALFENTLVVPWDHEGQSYLYAFDANTGSELWKVERDEPTTWATPLITKFEEVTQVIVNGTNRVRSYDLKDGRLIWECSGQVANPIPTPIRNGDKVIVMTGYRGFAIQSISLSSQGDVSGTNSIEWSRNDAAPYVSSGVLYEGTLYFTKSRDAIFSAVNAADGQVWIDQERLPQLDGLYASLAANNDRIYAVGRNGATAVIQHDKAFNLIGVNKLDEGIDASPVFADDCLFLRGSQHLYCIKEKVE